MTCDALVMHDTLFAEILKFYDSSLNHIEEKRLNPDICSVVIGQSVLGF